MTPTRLQFDPASMDPMDPIVSPPLRALLEKPVGNRGLWTGSFEDSESDGQTKPFSIDGTQLDEEEDRSQPSAFGFAGAMSVRSIPASNQSSLHSITSVHTQRFPDTDSDSGTQSLYPDSDSDSDTQAMGE